MSPFAASVSRLLETLGAGPVFIHSDLGSTASLVPVTRGREAILAAHVDLLHAAAHDRPLWMPAFNYDYPRTREFDARTARSQIGPLAEHFRTRLAAWRSPTPIFSISGNGPEPDLPCGEVLDPFGNDSGFAELARRDGVLLFYGAPLSSATILHYAERLPGGPLYRYDKRFPGHTTLMDGTRRPATLLYHVRPIDRHLEYDWNRLRRELIESGVLRIGQEPLRMVAAASARGFADRIATLLDGDPFGILDEESVAWVKPLAAKLGRRFQIEDFETASA